MPNVLVEEKDRTTIVTLNRPERRNALTIELMSELADTLDKTSADPQKRVLIVRGAGKAFCTGLDLQETTVVEKAHRSAEMVAKTLLAISQTRLITIAQVHGAAVAGGAGLMSACDFVVAAQRTKIGYPETRRGLVAGLVMTFLRRQLRVRPFYRCHRLECPDVLASNAASVPRQDKLDSFQRLRKRGFLAHRNRKRSGDEIESGYPLGGSRKGGTRYPPGDAAAVFS
jgi:hypothetical protein